MTPCNRRREQNEFRRLDGFNFFATPRSIDQKRGSDQVESFLLSARVGSHQAAFNQIRPKLK